MKWAHLSDRKNIKVFIYVRHNKNHREWLCTKKIQKCSIIIKIIHITTKNNTKQCSSDLCEPHTCILLRQKKIPTAIRWYTQAAYQYTSLSRTSCSVRWHRCLNFASRANLQRQSPDVNGVFYLVRGIRSANVKFTYLMMGVNWAD